MIHPIIFTSVGFAHAVVRFFRWALNAILFVAVATVSAYVVYTYTKTNVHPRTVKAIWADKPVELYLPEVKAGDVLVISILVDIHAEICRGEVHRWIIRSKDRIPVWYAIEPTQEVKPGRDRTINVSVRIPDDVSEGEYFYKSVVYDRRCDDVNRAFPPTTPAPVYFLVVP